MTLKGIRSKADGISLPDPASLRRDLSPPVGACGGY